MGSAVMVKACFLMIPAFLLGCMLFGRWRGALRFPAAIVLGVVLPLAIALWAQSGNVHEFDPKKIAENVQKQIVNGKELHDGDIILLHDTKDRMVPAVELIVPQLLEEGYQLVTVSELIYLSDIGFVPGRIYHSQTE